MTSTILHHSSGARLRRESWKYSLAGIWLLALFPAAVGSEAVAQTAPAPAPSQAAAPATPQQKSLTREQIEALVAPIALYSDALLAQVLMASTYPLEIVQATRWVQANPKVTGKALEDAMQQQTWDASVKSLAAVPQALQMLNDKLDWTQKLGDAFLAQQADVLDAVQRLRARAQAAGKLKTTKEQKVSTQSTAGKTVYVIEPANPQVVYVPTYNPATAYGGWPYPAYPPYSYYPPGYVAGGAISFGLGMAAGAALWGGCNWGNNQVNVNVNNYNSFNRTNIPTPTGSTTPAIAAACPTAMPTSRGSSGAVERISPRATPSAAGWTRSGTRRARRTWRPAGRWTWWRTWRWSRRRTRRARWSRSLDPTRRRAGRWCWRARRSRRFDPTCGGP